MNAVLCFVSDTLDLYFYFFLGSASLLPLFRARRNSPQWMGSPVNTSLCLFFPSVRKIMNSPKGAGDLLLYTLHLSSLCVIERQSGVEIKDEVQTGSNIIEAETEALGLRCPALIFCNGRG